MALSIRARLTLFYVLVLVVVLVAAAASVLALHFRLGLSGLDRELDNRVATLLADLEDELDEGVSLDEGAEEVVHELELPDTGVAVVDETGSIIAFRGLEVGDPLSGELTRDVLLSRTVDTPAGRVRLRPVERTDLVRVFRVVVWTPLEPLERDRATLVRALVFGLPLALLVAAAGAWTISRRALRPLEVMALQTEGISERRPDVRLSSPHPGDELGTLASAFNALLDRLAGALQYQRGFMADASHELRTPVSVARTTAQVTLSRETRTESEYRESLAIIADQTGRMSKMVDDMLVLALADSAGRPLQLEALYLDELVQECVRAAQVLGQKRRVGVSVTSPTDIECTGDEALLRQMLSNLLDNAVRHALSPGQVDVTVEPSDGSLTIVIADDGAGIPEADAERIFERFVSIDTDDKRGGGGLGLPIARWVAEAHGGSLRAEPGHSGGRLVVVLPASGRATGMRR